MAKPLVSVCTLTYNQENHIRECLDSILGQKCDFPFEVIVHDDASTDRTPEIIAEYAAKYPDIIKPIYQKENQYSKGLVYIYKIAVDSADGEYLAFCEGDDYWLDMQKLQKQVDIMRENPDCGLVHGRCEVIYPNNRIELTHTKVKSYSGRILKELLVSNYIYSPTPLFKAEMAKEAFDLYLGESVRSNWMTADLPLWLYIADKSDIAFINEPLAVYRVANSSISNTDDFVKRQKFEESVLSIRQYMMRELGVSRMFYNKISAKFLNRLYRTALKAKNREYIRKYRTEILANKWKLIQRPDLYIKALFTLSST